MKTQFKVLLILLLLVPFYSFSQTVKKPYTRDELIRLENQKVALDLLYQIMFKHQTFVLRWNEWKHGDMYSADIRVDSLIFIEDLLKRYIETIRKPMPLIITNENKLHILTLCGNRLWNIKESEILLLSIGKAISLMNIYISDYSEENELEFIYYLDQFRGYYQVAMNN